MPLVLFGEKAVEVGAVIYDKDGTLFDARVLWRNLETERFRILKESGVGQESLDWVGKAVGYDLHSGRIDRSGPLALATAPDEAVVAATGLYLSGYPWPEARRIALDAYNRAERELDISTLTALCEGIAESLRSLKSYGVPLGIVTTDTNERSRRMLGQAQILEFIDVITGSEDYSSPKPDPEPILKCCASLEVSPGDCAYVGDSPNDMLAAKNAGVKLGVGVLTGIGEKSALLEISGVVLQSAACIRPAAVPAPGQW